MSDEDEVIQNDQQLVPTIDQKGRRKRRESTNEVISLSGQILEVRAAIDKKLEEVTALQDAEEKLLSEIEEYLY
jgi:predicted house-cleaning noncanonical NTP pyrophosphatase (MazG superfamily)